MNSYETSNGMTYRVTKDEERELLANFTAKITKEIRYVDGRNISTFLTIEGEDKDGKAFSPATVPAETFASMSWVMPSWGVRAVMQSGNGIKDDLRAAIQLASTPEQTTIYRHVGWTELEGEPAYLHAKGAITASGVNPDIQVQLPPELSRYAIADAPSVSDRNAAIKASLSLPSLTTPETGWTLLAATLTPLFGPVDFAVHITGRTGTFKSELTSLYQSHYGPEMDSRHLPGSWSSTGNALEAQAYYVANAVFTIDDFIPTGTAWQQRAYHTNADKIIRAQGNQAGRARLTDTSNLQSAMYPRGLVLSTGEDTPDGHSVRARMMMLELSQDEIKPQPLTAAQQQRSMFQYTTAALIKHLCVDTNAGAAITERAKELRDENINIGHTRTPSMLGRLIATMEYVLDWIASEKVITSKQAATSKSLAATAITKAAQQQTRYLESTDPCDIFCQAFRQALGAGLGHIRTPNGGIPRNAEQLGWSVQDVDADTPTYKSLGPCIGWINWNEGEIYVECNIGYNVIKKAAGAELSLSKQTLMKRLKDAGVLTRTDETRQRNTVRVTADRHPRQVLSIAITQALDTQEIPNEGNDERDGYSGNDGE